MATIQVRNLDESVVRRWKMRAAHSGMSLQEYMRAHLTAGANKPTVEELVDQMKKRSRIREIEGTATDLPLEETLAGIDEAWE